MKTGMSLMTRCSGNDVCSGNASLIRRNGIRVLQTVVARALWLVLATLMIFARPVSASVLWQLDKQGNTHYLFGTIHIADADIIALPPQVERVVKSSRQLVVEAIADDQSRQSMAERTLMASNTLKGVLGPDLYAEVSQAAKARGVPPTSLMRLKPWAVGLMLNVPTPSLEPVLDVHLQYRFQDSGRPVHALETIDEQLDIFDELSMADQIEFLKSSLAQLDEFDANFARMKALYLAGDLDAIQAFSEQQSGQREHPVMQRLMQRILEERNVRMFARVQPYLAQSGTLIAVGALHLPGQQGLLQMFRQAGYTVTAVKP